MKKILSLTLVAVMLLSMLMLTSCDPVESVTDFFNGIFGEEEARTTISEDEWNKAWDVNNFTFKVEANGLYMHVYAAGDLAKSVQSMGDYTIDVIMDIKNGLMISDSSVGWLAVNVPSDYYPESITLGSIGYLENFEFAELTYDESKKAYVKEEEYASYEFRFEDGKLVYAECRPENYETEGLLTITDIGTTVVEVGEYTIINDGKVDPSKADADVRTTVTKEDLEAHLDLRNFTINLATMTESIVGGITFKVSSKGAELSLDMPYENETRYLANFNGTWYVLDNMNGEYVASQEFGTMAQLEEIISQIKESITTDLLTYNEEGRYYSVDVNGYRAYLYFENGQIVRAVVMTEVSYSTTMEIILEVTNVGSTKVTLPTYTIIK